jgi:hypothetical protein
MHPGESYRLNRNTVAIESGIGQRIIHLPERAVVTVEDTSPDESWFVLVSWREKLVSMFKIDLQDRGTRIEKSISARTKKRKPSAETVSIANCDAGIRDEPPVNF